MSHMNHCPAVSYCRCLHSQSMPFGPAYSVSCHNAPCIMTAWSAAGYGASNGYDDAGGMPGSYGHAGKAEKETHAHGQHAAQPQVPHGQVRRGPGWHARMTGLVAEPSLMLSGMTHDAKYGAAHARVPGCLLMSVPICVTG